jgi:hypothetical protein
MPLPKIGIEDGGADGGVKILISLILCCTGKQRVLLH